LYISGLLTGAQLCVFDLKTEGLNNLAAFWHHNGVTFSTLSVSTFQSVCRLNPSLQYLTSLRFISISAEPVKDTTLNLFKTTFGKDVTLQIAYATTETRTISEMKIRNDGQSISYPDAIGKPVAGKTVYITDEAGDALPTGNTGEIVVASEFIADAYYGQPTESYQSFIHKDGTVFYKTGDLGYLNEDGYLCYKGRLKNEHKLNGVKINLTDIEEKIEQNTAVLQVAVVINKSDTNQPKLTCFFVGDKNAGIDATAIKEAIAEKLPVTHIPHFYVALPKLPLTHSGKTDRKQLEFFNLKAHFDKPVIVPGVMVADSYENVIIDIFKDVLQLDNVNSNTDFFDAGGDSLSTLLCIADIEAKLKIPVNTTGLITNPTPKKLSDYLSQVNGSKRIFESIPLNGSSAGKRNLYLLDSAKNGRYKKLLSTALSVQFNLIEIIYDIYADPVEVLDQMALHISKNDKSVVVGHSFHGYVAHQLACKVTQIAYCVMMDTYDYFDYQKYIQPVTLRSKISRHYWHFCKNKDFKYPLHRLIIRYYKYKTRNKPVDSERVRLSALHNQRINCFLDSVNQTSTINNCIYFQGSRTHGNISQTWQRKVGGEFHFLSLICTHSNIVRKKAVAIADVIIKITQAAN
jgi:acyl carrier protein